MTQTNLLNTFFIANILGDGPDIRLLFYPVSGQKFGHMSGIRPRTKTGYPVFGQAPRPDIRYSA